MKEKKVWGFTELLDSNKVFEIHRITFEGGHHCSKHYHQTKYNGFYLISGKMDIEVWDTNNTGYVFQLFPGSWFVVKPGMKHRFRGVESGEALEIYWSEFQSNDIIREDVGK